MIVSHKHKFIFIKTKKTAGTSIEIALSKYCGPEDIITPISPEDEEKRTALGYRGPQNYLIPFSKYSKIELLQALYHRKRKAFYNHASASYVKAAIDENIWNSYFKFAFERNPWDKLVSAYYWIYKSEPRPSISEFIQSTRANRVNNFDLYTISADFAVDRVFLFEDIGQAMEEIQQRLNLPEVPSLPHAKSGYRKDKRSYREIMTEQDREKIARIYAREIAYFNYAW